MDSWPSTAGALEPRECTFTAQRAASKLPQSLAKQTVRRYLVRTPYSLDSITCTVRSQRSTSTQPASGASFDSRSRCIASGASSPRSCLPPGSWQAGAILEPSVFASCTKRQALAFWMRSPTTETTRSTSPRWPRMMVDTPALTSSRSFDVAVLALLPPHARAADECCCSMWSSTCSPMRVWHSTSIDSTMSSNSVKGTSRSLGQATVGGCAETRRWWKCLPYSALTRRTRWFRWRTFTNVFPCSVTTWHDDVTAVAVPTWIHLHHRAAVEIQDFSSSSVMVELETGEESGSWVYFAAPPTRK
mmetsp:Transcript_72597/g.205251  ORF Transcript_72597/g.205251 Transcript_72597/m.205251 type:complete len:303 (-) Transcript_72597:13-921(-)